MKSNVIPFSSLQLTEKGLIIKPRAKQGAEPVTLTLEEERRLLRSLRQDLLRIKEVAKKPFEPAFTNGVTVYAGIALVSLNTLLKNKGVSHV